MANLRVMIFVYDREEVRADIKRATLQYKNKTEERQDSTAWDSAKRMTGFHRTQKTPV